MERCPAVLADACPVCDPGIPPASLAVGEPQTVPGGTITAHECSVCGAAWETFWDHWGWPIDRLLADVTPDQASRNRAALDHATRGEAA